MDRIPHIPAESSLQIANRIFCRGFLSLIELITGYLPYKARNGMRLDLTANHSFTRGSQGKKLLGPGNSYITESSLFLNFILRVIGVDGHRAGEKPFLHPRHINNGELQPLGRVKRHEKDTVISVFDCINIRYQGYFLKKSGECGIIGICLILSSL